MPPVVETPANNYDLNNRYFASQPDRYADEKKHNACIAYEKQIVFFSGNIG